MGGSYYVTKSGDMWDYIAWVVYGDEMKMTLLMDAPENAELLNTSIFSDGERIWCPEAEEAEDDDVPLWRDSE